MSCVKLARRVTDIKISPSTAAAPKARDLKAEGRDIVDLTVGEPDFDTPDFIKAVAIEAIRAGDTKYTPVNGSVALRKAIQHDYSTRLGLDVALDAICVGGGAKQILFLALTATVEAGDEVTRDDIETIITEKPKVGMRLLEVLGMRLLETETRLEEVAFKRVPARVASLLLRLSEGTSPREVALSHQEVAEMLGVYRETVTNALDRLKADGAVEIGRRRIRLTNEELLREFAEE